MATPRSLAFLVAAALAAPLHAAAPIDVGEPGALEALAASHPDHYRRLTGLIAGASRLPCKSDEMEWLKARFEATGIGCTFLVMTSLPPKRRMTFSLDERDYVINVMFMPPAVPAQGRMWPIVPVTR